MIKTRGYAVHSPTSPLTPFSFDRREPGPHDVQIEILYCGICHTDLHQARNDWGGSMYPMVPGHEILGRVTRVGAQVTKVKADDYAGVGCMVDSCRRCPACNEGLEQFCEEGPTWTYNAKERNSEQMTFGGYSERVVVEERFVVKVPASMDMKAVAPLLCAGITTYSPLRHWKVGKGQKVGIVGLGGLGHMGLKFAHAFGAHVVLFTTSPNKTEDAKRLGADEVVISKGEAEMLKHAGSFDFILDAVSAEHDINAYLQMLKLDG